MSDIFSIKKDFRIARLLEGDAKYNTDNLRAFRNLVLENEEMYPGIEKWIDRKVIPGLTSRERTVFIGYLDEKPIVSAVVKHGANSKFCHLRISDDLQKNNLGEVFFSLMALEVRSMAKEIHFTLPESLWVKKHEFFKSYGFAEAREAVVQYRLFDSEFRCSAPFSKVWESVIEKLPKLAGAFSIGGYSTDNGLLLSLAPKYADMILNGVKRVEIRRRFSPRWAGRKVNLYSSYPDCALVGEAVITNVVAGEPRNIWEKYDSNIGCTKEEFDKYTKSTSEIFALVLDHVLPYRERVPLSQAAHLLNEDLKPPQSYCTLEKNKPWAKAVHIAVLLHGAFKIKIQMSPTP